MRRFRVQQHDPDVSMASPGGYEAFGRLPPVTEDYVGLPIEDGFDWERCAAGLAPVDLYLVALRSVRRGTAYDRLLKEYDDRAYDEALASGGVRYFKGCTNERCERLSFCLWQSRRHAVAAGANPLTARLPGSRRRCTSLTTWNATG